MNIKVDAFAKINLSIDIVSKMPNGYHNMCMIMQSVLLSDELTIRCEKGDGITIRTNLKYLPNDSRNIAARAADLFFTHTGIKGYKTDIVLKKSIPVCAGLGGGSTDGAAVLRGLNTLFETKLGRKTLEELGETLGSDVPFCIAGGTRLAEGKGEILTDVPALPACSIVICKPSFSISTPELFKKINCDKIQLRPDTDGLISALSEGNLAKTARRMYNVFEDVLPKNAGAINEIKQRLFDYGALGAVMTGTGSAVFGLFDDEIAAKEARKLLKQDYRECYLTKPGTQLEID